MATRVSRDDRWWLPDTVRDAKCSQPVVEGAVGEGDSVAPDAPRGRTSWDRAAFLIRGVSPSEVDERTTRCFACSFLREALLRSLGVSSS